MSLAAQDIGIILISSDLAEVLALADRFLVMHEGLVMGHLDRTEASEESILRLALGLAKQRFAGVKKRMAAEKIKAGADAPGDTGGRAVVKWIDGHAEEISPSCRSSFASPASIRGSWTSPRDHTKRACRT